MENAISKDGTKIAFEKSGEGPALIIVGGSLADHQFYAPLSSELAKHFTVYNFDRRGRGQSGDTLPYAVEREIEDVGALIAKAKESVFLYGHSAGAALALRAAAANSNILKLVLADPPYTPHGENDETAKAEYSKESARVQELHANGDHKANAALFLSGFGLPADDVNGMLEISSRRRHDRLRSCFAVRLRYAWRWVSPDGTCRQGQDTDCNFSRQSRTRNSPSSSRYDGRRAVRGDGSTNS